MDRSSAGLGDRCIQQIGANCRSGMEPEEQNKQRRHQRSATDAGQAHDEAHAESRQGIGGHDKFKRAHGMNSWAFTAREPMPAALTASAAACGRINARTAALVEPRLLLFRGRDGSYRRTGAIRQATEQGTPSAFQSQRQPTRGRRGRERPEPERGGGFLSSGTLSRSLPVLYSDPSTRRTNRGGETMEG